MAVCPYCKTTDVEELTEDMQLEDASGKPIPIDKLPLVLCRVCLRLGNTPEGLEMIRLALGAEALEIGEDAYGRQTVKAARKH